jgi:hypothetical protein
MSNRLMSSISAMHAGEKSNVRSAPLERNKVVPAMWTARSFVQHRNFPFTPTNRSEKSRRPTIDGFDVRSE